MVRRLGPKLSKKRKEMPGTYLQLSSVKSDRLRHLILVACETSKDDVQTQSSLLINLGIEITDQDTEIFEQQSRMGVTRSYPEVE